MEAATALRTQQAACFRSASDTAGSCHASQQVGQDAPVPTGYHLNMPADSASKDSVKVTNPLSLSFSPGTSPEQDEPSPRSVELAAKLIADDADAADDDVKAGVAPGGLIGSPRQGLDASGHENERDRRRRMELEQLEAHGLISPESSFRRRWDIAQICFLVYVAVGVPYRMGFGVDVVLWSFPSFWVELLVDLYFIADVFVSLRSAYYDKRGDLVADPVAIRQYYIWSPPFWFFIDVSACFPVSYIEWAFYSEGTASSSNKSLKLLRLLRLLKLLRLLRVNRLMARYEEEFAELMNTLKLGKILVVMAVIGHWLACLWYGSGTYVGSAEQCGVDVDGAPLECTGWVDRKWGDGAAARDNSTAGTTGEWERYVASVYWSMMTMTTVGYGDIVPRNAVELLMAIAGMVTGGFVFGMIVGSLAELSKRSNASDIMRQKHMEKVNHYLAVEGNRNVPRDLLRAVRAYYSQHYNHRRAGDDLLRFMSGLPPTLRTDLAQHISWVDDERGQGVLSKVPFFAGLDPLTLITINAKMNIVIFPPMIEQVDGKNVVRSNLIMEQGRVGQQMFVVVDGADIIMEQDGVQTNTLGTSDFFGESAALFRPGTFVDAEGNPIDGQARGETVYASTFEVTLGSLTYEDIQALRRECPALSKTLVPYASKLAERMRAAGNPRAAVTALDCYPELETLDAALASKFDLLDGRLARIEASLQKLAR